MVEGGMLLFLAAIAGKESGAILPDNIDPWSVDNLRVLKE